MFQKVCFDLLNSSRPGRPPKRVPLGLSLAASHLQPGHPQLKKARMENGDYGHFENGQISGEFQMGCSYDSVIIVAKFRSNVV